MGGLLEQQGLRALAGCCSRATRTATSPPAAPPAVRRRRDRALPRARRSRPGLRLRRARRRSAACPCPGRATAGARATWPPRRSTATWTATGAARPTATSPPPPTRRASRASPRSPSSPTSPSRPPPRGASPTTTRSPRCSCPHPPPPRPGRRPARRLAARRRSSAHRLAAPERPSGGRPGGSPPAADSLPVAPTLFDDLLRRPPTLRRPRRPARPRRAALRPLCAPPPLRRPLPLRRRLFPSPTARRAFGTFVHTCFEAIDFAAPDLDAELTPTVRRGARAAAGRHRRSQTTVIAGLRAAIETPLGPLVGGLRLRDVARADRLDELTFELPLAGGDEPVGEVTPGRDRRRPARAPRRRRSARGLRRPARRPGAAGERARLPDRQHRPRGARRRGVRDRRLQDELARRARGVAHRLAHRPAALAAEMQRAHYGLQALLYTAALHRYLRWRLPGYDPASATSPACSTCSCAG